jgi:hypothetical protein
VSVISDDGTTAEMDVGCYSGGVGKPDEATQESVKSRPRTALC